MCAIENRSVSITPIKSIFRARRVHSTCHWRGARRANKKKSSQEEKYKLTNESDKFDSRFYLSDPGRCSGGKSGHEDELELNSICAIWSPSLASRAARSRTEALILFSSIFLCNQLLCEGMKKEHKKCSAHKCWVKSENRMQKRDGMAGLIDMNNAIEPRSKQCIRNAGEGDESFK